MGRPLLDKTNFNRRSLKTSAYLFA